MCIACLYGEDCTVCCIHETTCLPPQERSLERLPALSPIIACYFVRLVELLVGCPPRLDCLYYVCDHLLVSDINELKLVTGPASLETSVSVFDGEQVGTTCMYVYFQLFSWYCDTYIHTYVYVRIFLSYEEHAHLYVCLSQ